MNVLRVVSVGAVAGLLLAAGCSRTNSKHPTEPHEGPKVNLVDFLGNTANYKGKAITLVLKIDEATPRSGGQPDFAGRDVKFAVSGPKGEHGNLVVTIPQGLSVPDLGNSDEMRVTFVCTSGNLRQGNMAKSISKP
jgi:hypothetical protein